eukprot:4284248-Prorocentrum_lima.AAC.1
MCIPDDVDEVFEDPPPPALQQDGPQHPLQGEDVDIRSDTPTGCHGGCGPGTGCCSPAAAGTLP